MRCHFVPQAYLRRFLNEQNLLECFDLNRQFGPTKPKAVKKTAQLEDWYVLTGLDELPNASRFGEEKMIEEEYQRLFENDLTASLDRLEGGAITARDKETIANFMAFQLHRVPISREYHLKMQSWDPAETRTKEETMRRIGEIVLGHIGTSISAISLAPYLLKSEWMLVRRKCDLPFITSDNPVGLGGHPSNQSFVPILELAGVQEPELKVRKTAYTIAVSPRHVLYVNTSKPTNADDVHVATGSWDEPRVRVFNDTVFRSCLSCVYTVERAVADEFFRRFSAGEIANDLFVDDPWGLTEPKSAP